jgi:transposase
MGSSTKEALRPLSPAELTLVEQVAHATSERLDRVRRARALLAVAQGASLTQAAQQAGWRSHTGVAKLVARFNRRGVASLSIAPGRGRKVTYTTAARSQIVRTAQREPDRRTDHTATWSLSLLQRRLRGEGLARIGTSTIRRVLQDAGSSWQRSRTWCPTGTALRKRKAGVVQVVDPATEEKKA